MFKAIWSIPEWGGNGFPKETPLLSFSWGSRRIGTSWEGPHTSGSDAGTVRDITVVRRNDEWSARLFNACAGAEMIGLMRLTLSQVDGNTIKVYATYTFENCYITFVRPGGPPESENEKPLEEIGVNFAKTSYSYDM
jgi:type VI protein secretion system component Hcp